MSQLRKSSKFDTNNHHLRVELLVWQWVASHVWAKKRVVHLLVGTSQLTFLHTHWGWVENEDRYIYMCDGNILFSLCLFFRGSCFYHAGCHTKYHRLGGLKQQTFILHNSIRKLKGLWPRCLKTWLLWWLFGLPGPPFHWAPHESALWASAPLCISSFP